MRLSFGRARIIAIATDDSMRTSGHKAALALIAVTLIAGASACGPNAEADAFAKARQNATAITAQNAAAAALALTPGEVVAPPEPPPPAADEAALTLQEVEGAVQETTSGLKYVDVEPGTGAIPRSGQTVAVHYSGWLTNGLRFDSSYERNQPLRFELGAGRVIKGWDEGVGSMRVGGKRRLIIPPELGYGAIGNGPIPPNATIIFDVQLVSAG